MQSYIYRMAEKEGKIYHGQDYKSVFNSKDYLNYVAGELSTFLRFLHDSFSKGDILFYS